MGPSGKFPVLAARNAPPDLSDPRPYRRYLVFIFHDDRPGLPLTLDWRIGGTIPRACAVQQSSRKIEFRSRRRVAAMSRSFSMPLGKLGGHATVQLGRSTAPAGLQLRRDISTTQRRLRQALRPRPVQLRLRAPLKGRKAVQAHRVQMEIERLKGSRFSPVHEKPRVPTQLSKACMKALGFTGLKATGSSIASSSFNFLKATTLSLLGHGPIDWRTSILFIDLANSVRGLKVHMRRTGPPMNVTRRILMDLVHISKLRGCQVYVMVYVS